MFEGTIRWNSVGFRQRLLKGNLFVSCCAFNCSFSGRHFCFLFLKVVAVCAKPWPVRKLLASSQSCNVLLVLSPCTQLLYEISFSITQLTLGVYKTPVWCSHGRVLCSSPPLFLSAGLLPCCVLTAHTLRQAASVFPGGLQCARYSYEIISLSSQGSGV